METAATMPEAVRALRDIAFSASDALQQGNLDAALRFLDRARAALWAPEVDPGPPPAVRWVPTPLAGDVPAELWSALARIERRGAKLLLKGRQGRAAAECMTVAHLIDARSGGAAAESEQDYVDLALALEDAECREAIARADRGSVARLRAHCLTRQALRPTDDATRAMWLAYVDHLLAQVRTARAGLEVTEALRAAVEAMRVMAALGPGERYTRARSTVERLRELPREVVERFDAAFRSGDAHVAAGRPARALRAYRTAADLLREWTGRLHAAGVTPPPEALERERIVLERIRGAGGSDSDVTRATAPAAVEEDGANIFRPAGWERLLPESE